MTRKLNAGRGPKGQAKPDSRPPPQSDIDRKAEILETGPQPDAGTTFPIVGIGSSAGGLEAMELFLANVPPESGMAFIMVQHLDPTHKGVLPELLQRSTAMEVLQVQDGTPIRPDCVYVIPPNADMSILRGVLHLLEPDTPRGLRLPIDYFFRSLAYDLRDQSIGVILSGMGADGTQGFRAIKEQGGATFVQEPSTAKFDAMPRSTIDAGLADDVDLVEALPGKILAYLRRMPARSAITPVLGETDQRSIDKVAILLRARTGHDFSLYKKSTLYRRIERRMGLHQIDRIASYVRFLRENPLELELLFKELLIGVTSFFRDPDAWEILKSDVIPAMLAGRPPGHVFRAWTPACSTGEEAYTLAIVFKEAIELIDPSPSYTLQIFATDLDGDAIDRARAGTFPDTIAADVSPERLERFFVKTEQGYSVRKPIREMVVFAPQNVIMDPPFTRIDIVSCRNLLIYLAPELQKKLIPLFHYSINSQGILFLGSAETIGGFADLFEPLEAKARIYKRRETVLGMSPVEFPSTFVSQRPGARTPPTAPPTSVNLQSLADHLLLQTYAPAAVLTNDQGDILYISGRTGKYLEPAAGKANWNIFAMAREGLRFELTSAFRKALRQKEAITTRDIRIVGNGSDCAVNLTVQAIAEPEALKGLLMIILAEALLPSDLPVRDTGGRHANLAIVKQMERELEQARCDVQSIREEMQTSQEELKSGNEEMQSMNEELQSTNEELTTSKEEMQSMNEELQTLNQELQAKFEDLMRLNSDMKNLLESTEIATLFLDDALLVRLFTVGARKVFKLIHGDVGRPITDIASELHYPELASHAHEVRRTLQAHEQEVPARDTSWYRVRIMPYRTLDNRVEGVVITFTDISVSKTLEAQLRKTQLGLENVITGQATEIAAGEARRRESDGDPSNTPKPVRQRRNKK